MAAPPSQNGLHLYSDLHPTNDADYLLDDHASVTLGNVPVIIRCVARRIPGWNLINNLVDDIDRGPHAVGEEPS